MTTRQPRPTGHHHRHDAARRGTLIATTAAVAAVALVAGGATVATAKTKTLPASPVVTRAGLDPALIVDHRGAEVAFEEQRAVDADHNGTVLAESRDAYTLASEATGRSAVSLAPGQWVKFTLPNDTNAITVRYAIPDSADGGGITAPLEVDLPRGKDRTMTLTSEYSWLYNQYPFTNDPNSGLLHPDWWVSEFGGVPGVTEPEGFEKPFRPFHFYDEQRLLLGKTYRAGDVVTLRVPTSSAAEYTVIDVLDTELVGKPYKNPHAVNVMSTGADPKGKRDSADAIDRAIALAKKRGTSVYVPPGTYKVDRHIIVDDVTIEGAGHWYTTFKGSEVALDEPAADGSIHTGVGFYGKWAEDGGSSNVHLSGFAIEGDVRERIDTDQVNGIGGAFSDSTFDGLHVNHTKVAVWLDGPMSNVSVTNNIFVNQIADALNFHKGVTDSHATNNFIRNTGDDGLAMWADSITNARNTFDHNTVQSPVLANGIAIYGGEDITVSNNLVADPVREGSGIHLGSRFGAEPFAGTISVTDNTVVRAGSRELNWNIGMGALWIYALDRSIDADIQIVGDHFLDSTYYAMMFVTEWGVKDDYVIDGINVEDVRIDGTGFGAVSARSAGSATFTNVDARNIGERGINNCGAFNWDWDDGSEFSFIDGGGNDGVDNNPWEPGVTNWFTRYIPNTITCLDDGPLNPAPAPSSWEQPVTP
ncbi:glycosyl hydrolase family 28-related protein [Demequina aurantiaca]|uniref:glycosyl hydrolase family 28-related protein n=1 Tax=Demequina aurantiaca TaxID=676200 RepID=UPI000A03552B|nr:glycosyl hydrolase family 28-related protein [Demequina aurantiaca]